MDHTDRPSLDRLPSKPPVVVAYDTKEFVEDLGFRELQELQWHETAQVDGVGSYNPWIRRHADPEQAWQMFREIGARYLMPMHWRTFRLSDEPIFEPIERLKVAAALQAYQIALDSIGQTWLLPG
jgi:L-ascorbate metabolism protein UlaG (beta-lactamase superfamily)